LNREENSSKSENRQQSDHKGKGLSADVDMVFMLPMEFLAPFIDDEEVDLPDQIAQLALDPMTAMLKLCLSKAGLMAADVQDTN